MTTPSLPARTPRRTALLAVALALASTLGGCVRAAALTNGCDAFADWAADGAPSDLSSPHEGPRYLAFLARVQDEAAAVEAEAAAVLGAAQRAHDAWAAAGGPQGPTDQVERATATAADAWTDEVRAAATELVAYGTETCGVDFPS